MRITRNILLALTVISAYAVTVLKFWISLGNPAWIAKP